MLMLRMMKIYLKKKHADTADMSLLLFPFCCIRACKGQVRTARHIVTRYFCAIFWWQFQVCALLRPFHLYINKKTPSGLNSTMILTADSSDVTWPHIPSSCIGCESSFKPLRTAATVVNILSVIFALILRSRFSFKREFYNLCIKRA